MSNIKAKTSSNIFYQTRCEASKHNEQLSSREGAADIMSIDRGRLYRIESGVMNPYPEEVHMMADLYNAPELRNYYCRGICPLGSDVPKGEMVDIDRITVKAMSTLRKITATKDALLDITEDGVIDESEKPILEDILKVLDEVNEVAASLKNWVKKNGMEV